MSPVPKEQIDQVKSEIHSVLGKGVSDLFMGRVDAILDDWSAGKLTAAVACEKVQKLVALFIDQDKAREIGSRFAPIVMRESVSGNK
jgi:acyl CoA:acetate/3-ketoacid CoA transferase alpha subunit